LNLPSPDIFMTWFLIKQRDKVVYYVCLAANSIKLVAVFCNIHCRRQGTRNRKR